SPDQTASARRREGYAAALAQNAISFDPALVQPGLFTYRSGLDAAEKLLALDVRPTAIFASNDDMAAAAVATAHRRGLDVPGDLTVCGFDNTSLATTIWPELTTVRQPISEMAGVAVALLTEAISSRRGGRKEQRDQHMTFDHVLIHRESTGAPPA
ncbi:MAG: substrate-binding domain-containing protein, partial [Novosphingobium sp.]